MALLFSLEEPSTCVAVLLVGQIEAMDDFVHLHNHSTHSYLDGYGNPDQVLIAAKEKGFKAMALTDHGNLDGAIPFYFKAKELGIKPILGVEAYICHDARLMERGGTNPIKHITLLAKSAVGYTSLCRLMTSAWKDGYYYKPRIDFNLLEKFGTGLIVLSGCPNGPAFDDVSLLKRLKDRFGPDFYLELMPVPEPSDYSDKVQALWAKASALGIKPVLTGDCHYPNKGDAEIQDVMLTINTKSYFDSPDRMKMAPIYWQRSLLELNDHAKQWLPWMTPKLFNQAVESTLAITEKVDIKLETSVPIRFDCGRDKPIDVLWNLALKGIDKRRLEWSEEYDERFKTEMALIQEKSFADYFLVVADVVGHAKSNGMLVGPARGSSAGSLVCYLTGITEIDPMPHGLLFERFIDQARNDLPDIDLDFEDRHRDVIIEYLKEKYHHVGVLSAWSQWKAKSCLLDVARVFNIPHEEIKKITPLVIQRSGGDARASFTLMDTVEEFPVAKDVFDRYPALKHSVALESQVKQKTRHAAGVIISSDPIDKFASLYKDDCLSIDGAGSKMLGALKLDVLGINTLTVLSKAMELIKKRHNKTFDIYSLPLEDPKVLKGFRDRRLAGIFQYEGGAMKSVNRRIPAKCFADLAIINAASRPGPLHCGGTAAYINRLNGKEAVTFLHPALEPLLGHTMGIPMYQEQVLKVMRQIGDLPWTKVGMVQKIMSRRTGVEAMNKMFEEFKAGAGRKGISPEIASAIWHDVQTFGSWAFNQSHAVSYSVLAYWTMWMKVYYPEEFYASSIAYTSSEERKAELIREWKKIGGKILQVKADKSSIGCILEGQSIRMGWTDIKGIGESIAKRLVENAPFKSTADLVTRAKLGKTSLKLLEDLGIVERLQLDMFKGDGALDRKLLAKHCPWLFDLHLDKHRNPFCTTLEKIEPASQQQQFTVVGVILDIGLRDLNEINAKRGEGAGKKIEGLTKFANIIIEDEDDSLLVTFSKKTYPRFADKIWKDGGIGNIIRVSGVVLPEMRKLYANTLDIMGRIGEE